MTYLTPSGNCLESVSISAFTAAAVFRALAPVASLMAMPEAGLPL